MEEITAQLFDEMVSAVHDLLRVNPTITIMPNVLYIIGKETKGMVLSQEEEKEIAHRILARVSFTLKK